MVKPVLVVPISRESAVDARLAALLLHHRSNRARVVLSKANLDVVDHFDTISRLKLGENLSHFQFIHRAGSSSSAEQISNQNEIATPLLKFDEHVVAY